MRPTSSTTVWRATRTAPVSSSISTSHTWHPLGKVTAGGVNAAVSLKPGSIPAGSRRGW